MELEQGEPPTNMVQFNVRIPKELARKIVEFGKSSYRSKNKAATYLLEKALSDESTTEMDEREEAS